METIIIKYQFPTKAAVKRFIRRTRYVIKHQMDTAILVKIMWKSDNDLISNAAFDNGGQTNVMTKDDEAKGALL